MAELRVLTYNVRSLQDDADAVADVIRACEPAVVAVQEAPRKLRWRSKRAALARKSGLVVATANGPGGLMLMTTLAVQVRGTRFAMLPKSPNLHQRVVVAADLELAGARWTVAAIPFSLDAGERGRHLDPLWAAIDDAPGPLVVAGDVNEKPEGEVWKQLATRFQDAYAVAPDGPDLTFSTRNPRKRIDAVFAAPGIEVVSCHAVHEVPARPNAPGVSSEAGGPDAPGVDLPRLRAASDHFPVLAVLRQPPH